MSKKTPPLDSARKGIQQRIDQGILQGVKKQLKVGIDMALSMLRDNIDIASISEETGIAEEDIEKLKKGIE